MITCITIRFGELGDYQLKNLGSCTIDNIIINTIAPVLFAYGLYHKALSLKDKVCIGYPKQLPKKIIIQKAGNI
jgi:hypothetical protein